MDSVLNLVSNIRRENGYGVTTILKSTNSSIGSIDFLSIEYQIPNDLKPIVLSFIQYNKSLFNYDYVDMFNTLAELLKNFNRFAESQDVWVITPLIYLTKTIIPIAIKADAYMTKNPNTMGKQNIGDFEVESCLIKTARIVHNSFKLCLNDRNEDELKSRKSKIYFFVGIELKIYFNLQNRDLAKNMEKVLLSKAKELPNLNDISKSHAITYLYYSGATSCGDSDFHSAYQKFKKAFELCDAKDLKHKELILVYLIPLKFLTTKKLFNLNKNQHYSNVYQLYYDLQIALKRGDLKTFELFFNRYEDFLLKKNLYFVIENIRNFILLKLIKKIYQLNNSENHLPISLITRGIEFSKYHTNNPENQLLNIGVFSNDETECLVANLIYKNYIRGYLSHTNGVLVLSKKEPFPTQVKSDDEI